ncbi:hypothetical protein CPB85DRAFT_1417289, partial [Mucidula mucida]
WDWNNLEKYELGCSFSVPLFLGEVPEDSKIWLCCDTFAGARHVYVRSLQLNHAIARHSRAASAL